MVVETLQSHSVEFANVIEVDGAWKRPVKDRRVSKFYFCRNNSNRFIVLKSIVWARVNFTVRWVTDDQM